MFYPIQGKFNLVLGQLLTKIIYVHFCLQLAKSLYIVFFCLFNYDFHILMKKKSFKLHIAM